MQFSFKVSNDCNSDVLIITVKKMLIQYNTEGYSRNIETLVSDDEDDIAVQLPAEDEVLLQKLREESRAVFLQRKSRELLDNEELQVNTSVSHNTMTYFYMSNNIVGFYLMSVYSSSLCSCRTCGSCSISTRCLQ